MPTLQRFVSNTPLTLAKNLRFQDANGLPVSQLLPIGMNGDVVADSPTTGYISRIGSVLSQQIDLYNDVANTLNSYQTDIYNLQKAVDALEISGTTIPIVNGYCFNGNANGYITDVVEAMAQALCPYIPIFGTSTALMQAIQAEGATTLNVMPSYSIPAGAMQALSGWVANPQTLASSVNNLWLSYLDSRTALTTMLKYITPSCSNNIIDFSTYYNNNSKNAGILVYFNGYSFPASAYTDEGSSVTITDQSGGKFVTAIDLVRMSQPGTDPLFVGISGTPLSPTASYYTVMLNSILGSSSNNCTKTVIHTTAENSPNSEYLVGNYQVQTSGTTSSIIISGIDFSPSFVNIMVLDSATRTAFSTYPYYISLNASGFTMVFSGQAGPPNGTNLNFKWIVFR